MSRYFITWVCFLYLHLCHIDWIPAVEQVNGTMPHAFKEKYPKTYIKLTLARYLLKLGLIYSYSHQRGQTTSIITLKSLVGCSAVSFVSELYMGSISDVQLTSASGLLHQLTVMADRGLPFGTRINPLEWI